ncbi:MAG: acyl carrier protein [Caulobacterales bacterium]|jgi:acyl carrier protein
MTPSDIRAVFKDELGRIAPEVDLEAIDPAADLREQTDIDSMDFLNLVTALHVRLGLEIPEADYPKLATLESALRYLGKAT